jgi:hypothetical protein
MYPSRPLLAALTALSLATLAPAASAQRAMLATSTEPSRVAAIAHPATASSARPTSTAGAIATTSRTTLPALDLAAPSDTLAFAHAMLLARRVDAIPVLERMAVATRDQQVLQPFLIGVAAELGRTQ